MCVIDTSFDFQLDTPEGKDPDAASPTLRRYHKTIWSKPLPSGAHFGLVDTTPGIYLHHQSKRGDLRLSSDSIIPTYTRYKDRSIVRILSQIPENDLVAFRSLGYTIGGMIIFPSNQIDRKPTINGARGLSAKIKDRFDLTLECIRRYYEGNKSPLYDTLSRYTLVFELFESFRGYVEFFLLQDLVKHDCAAVDFFLPFSGFDASPLPSSKGSYLAYMERSIGFLARRNHRISAFCRDNHLQ